MISADKQYAKAKALLENQLAADPIQQFAAWFKEAEEKSPGDWFFANAMNLSTTDDKGQPSSRIVLLKEATEQGFVFFSHYESKKGKELSHNPQAALTFYWGHTERQIRIEGKISRVSAETSTAYFHSRPRSSQVSAYCSPQSNTIEDTHWLEQQVSATNEKYQDKPIPRPENWGGYCLTPNYFEFWQGRLNRLHDRLTYQLSVDNSWQIKRLAP